MCCSFRHYPVQVQMIASVRIYLGLLDILTRASSLSIVDDYKMSAYFISPTFVRPFFGTIILCIVSIAQALPHSSILTPSGAGSDGPNSTSTTPPKRAITLGLRRNDASSALQTPNTAPSSLANSTLPMSAQVMDQSHNDLRDPAILMALIIFLLFSLLFLTIYFFGPSLRRRILKKLSRHEKPGLGFGFDGLSNAELKAARLKEEKAARNECWFIKLPAKPPALALKHCSPLPPIELSDDHSESSHGYDDEKRDIKN